MTRDFVHTSESVTEGHPDKMCDQISDAVVDRFLEQDPKSRIIAETAVSVSVVFLAARFSSNAKVDFTNVARKVIRKIGYLDGEFNYKTCSILTSIKDTPPEQDSMFDERYLDDDAVNRMVAHEQVTLFGFACAQTPTLLPLPIWLAHKIARRLTVVRREGILPYLAPDGTTQVGVVYRNRMPVKIHSMTVNCSQLDRSYPNARLLRKDMLDAVIYPVFEDESVKPDGETSIFTNPGGPLKMGGPPVHSGLTGRKNAIDTYGGYSRNSGSALSGKDPMRIDRLAAYAARYAAKNVVAAGLAQECEVQLSYAIGLPGPVSVQVRTKGTSTVPEERINTLVEQHFDFRLGAILREFDMRYLPSRSKRGFYRKLAAYGHVGRNDLDLPWERTDKAERLKEDA